ncbi:MAG: hypothetical protein V4850_36465 [Myxococcota bacterium]
MNRGFQIVEPEGLSKILGTPEDFPITVALLHWLIEQLKLELGAMLDSLELEVIWVEYLGAYPALGIRYLEEREDAAPLIESTIDRLLRERPVASFVDHLARYPSDWVAFSARLTARSSDHPG